MKKFIKIAFFFYALTLTFACKNKQITESEQKKIFTNEIKQLEKQYESKIWTERKEAVIKCSEYPSERTMRLLINATNDTHNTIIAEALMQLSFYKTDEAYNTLLTFCENKNLSDIVRISAIKGISKYKTPKAVPVFLTNIQDKNAQIREASYAGLLVIENKKTENLSIEYILLGLSDTNTNVQMAVLDNIRIKNPLIYKVFKDFVTSPENYNKNTMMIKVLSNLVGYDIDEELEISLRTLLVNNNVEIRLLTLKVLKNQPKNIKK